MELTLHQFKTLCSDMMDLGAKKILVELDLIKPFISKNQAYKKYGQGTVNRWIDEGLITPQKDGTATSSLRLDRMELEVLSKISNRHTYKTVAERHSK